MENLHKGSCLCGRVKYEVEGAFENFYFCHCSRCQKDTGSAHAANLFSSQARLNWTTDTTVLKTFMLPQTLHSRNFCGECGSPLPSMQMDGRLLVVPAGSLDTVTNMLPTAHIFCGSRASWEDKLSSIRKYEGYPQN